MSDHIFRSHQRFRHILGGVLITPLAFITWTLFAYANAQTIEADTSLPNPSIVNIDPNGATISGGTIRETNLFHSFSEFSVPEGSSAIFLNDDSIERIFSRVTGNSRSQIDGLMSNRGSADLFFINPNGIIFGDNAELDIRGSFIASTATSILFNDFEFAAENPASNATLTISAPIGLQFGANSGAIQTTAPLEPLSVPNNRTLALLGNSLTLDNSTLFAEEGRIELGSIADNQTVALVPNPLGWEFDYSSTSQFADITATNATIIDVGGDIGGSIQVYGQNLTLEGGSQISTTGETSGVVGSITVQVTNTVDIAGFEANKQRIRSGIFLEVKEAATGADSQLFIAAETLRVREGGTISTNTLGTGQGANLIVNARSGVNLQGAQSLSTGLFAQVEEEDATGQGGNILLETPDLLLMDGARISTTTFGEGDAGGITIEADQIRLNGTTANRKGKSIISAIAATTGNVAGSGGPITITTNILELNDGAQIITSTRGTGSGATLRITAQDSINIEGTAPDASATIGRSGLFVASERTGEGDVGNLVVRSPILTLSDRAEISANTFRGGASGQIRMDVDRLSLKDGSQIRANSFRTGEGGRIIINVLDDINISGTGIIDDQLLASGISSRVPRRQASADAGAIRVRGDRLTLTDGATINVSNVGAGVAGDLRVQASQVKLNQGTITASTQAGGGAEIRLNVSELLVLNQASNVTAQAFDVGNGGNITINSPNGVITAIADQDSNIVAKAEDGDGGNIDITTQAIFNLQERPEVPITNDIDASSEFGLDGSVNINGLEVDPSRGLVALPSGVVDVSRLIAQQCNAGGYAERRRSDFVITGQGGLVPAPGELLGQAFWDDMRSPFSSPQALSSSIPDAELSPFLSIAKRPIEAQAWSQNPNGQILLIAQTSTAQPAHNTQWQPSPTCTVSR